MKFALAILAFTALIHTTKAQTSATVLIQDSVQDNSYRGYMSTSFVGLKLPSGGGSVSITFTAGDSADGSYVTSYADHTQSVNYYQYYPTTTSITIGATGHYWVYLAGLGSTDNWDYLEIRVEASTYVGTVTCTYCAPPIGWGQGYPPLGTHQETGVVPVSSQPGSPHNSMPRWVVPVLAVVIAIATLLPISYCLYRRHQNKKAMSSSSWSDESSIMGRSSVELQTTSAV